MDEGMQYDEWADLEMQEQDDRLEQMYETQLENDAEHYGGAN